MVRVIAAVAIVEAVTGVALVIAPSLVAYLLLGGELQQMGIALARFTGFARLGLGIACFPRGQTLRDLQPVRGLIVYQMLAALFFLYLTFQHQFVGVLLWPVLVAHVVFAILLIRILARPVTS